MPFKMLRIFFWIFICVLLAHTGIIVGQDAGDNAVLLRKISIPEELAIHEEGCRFGGDLRIGDLDNDGSMDFLIYRAAKSWKSTQPSFLAAFTMDGRVLWKMGSGGHQPNRPGPVCIYDIDRDGETEVICMFAPDTNVLEEFSMKNMTFMIIDGKTGRTEKQKSIREVNQCSGKGANWIHQRILIAHLRPTKNPQDFIIKLGQEVFAIDQNLNLLWQYHTQWNEYGRCPAYVPALGDMDGDGRDEINGGYFLLSPEGKPYWERQLGPHMDCVLITEWDSVPRAFCSGHGFIMGLHGDTVLQLGEKEVPHGQELRVADFIPDSPGREMAIRHKGHNKSIIVAGQDGTVLSRYAINPSPNNTGMTEIFWKGADEPALLYNGGILWKGNGNLFDSLEVLVQPPQGYYRQGWYHCIPADLAGDDGEEIVVYNPWEDKIFIFGRSSQPGIRFKPYVHTARQYNPRIMD
jgi:hypothetical protein